MEEGKRDERKIRSRWRDISIYGNGAITQETEGKIRIQNAQGEEKGSRRKS